MIFRLRPLHQLPNRTFSSIRLSVRKEGNPEFRFWRPAQTKATGWAAKKSLALLFAGWGVTRSSIGQQHSGGSVGKQHSCIRGRASPFVAESTCNPSQLATTKCGQIGHVDRRQGVRFSGRIVEDRTFFFRALTNERPAPIVPGENWQYYLAGLILQRSSRLQVIPSTGTYV